MTITLNVSRRQYNNLREEEKQLLEAAKETRKRRSRRLSEQQEKRLKSKQTPQAYDSVQVPGRQGTLGALLSTIGNTIPIKDSKSKYFAYLDLDGFPDLTKIKSLKAAKRVLNEVGNYTPVQPASNFDKDLDVLQHSSVYVWATSIQSHMLSDAYLRQCSEASLVTKFWGPIFEEYFGYDRDIFLQWGDTLETKNAEMGMMMRLDLRVILTHGETIMEGATGEFARATATTKKKLFGDKLKSVLATKIHLNSMVSEMTQLPAKVIPSINIPIIQIMGFNCHLYSLNLADKGLYCLRNISSCVYPRTLDDMANGKMKKLLECMSLVKEMIYDLKEANNNNSRDTANSMTLIVVRVCHCNKDMEYDSYMIYDIKDFGICSSSDKGSDDDFILVAPLSMSYIVEDVFDGAGTIGV
ncbi:hypothetical protein [Absidia glauca]|uniref:Uncharacterized protein n=1 Tax=Absidia glauca TaxID=4829 RepID=A0A168SG81_ABSGL|nr:hypothetical protein [Absidia glauca]